MGVLQNISTRIRSLFYDRAERFIKAEDERRREGLSERFNNRFVEFYDENKLSDRGYGGYDDFGARMLFKVYDQLGEKGLELVRFNDGVKLDSGDILNLLHFVEYCEIIENSDKGMRKGINLALRLIDEFSLEEIVSKLNTFQEPYLVYTLNLRHKLEQPEQERGQKETANEKEEELFDDEPEREVSDEVKDTNNFDERSANNPENNRRFIGDYDIPGMMNTLANNAWYGRHPTTIRLSAGDNSIELNGYTYEPSYESFSATASISFNGKILYGQDSRNIEAYRNEVYNTGIYETLEEAVEHINENVKDLNISLYSEPSQVDDLISRATAISKANESAEHLGRLKSDVELNI